jgi:hypothetical protein
MRFYNPETNPPECVDSQELFPKVDEVTAAQRCLKLGYLPSVTTVLGVIRQEWLEKWKMREAIKRFETTGNAWVAVQDQYNKDSKESLFGTSLHDCVNKFLNGNLEKKDTIEAKHALPLMQWLEKNMRELILTEGTLACRETGCAGTVDLVFVDKDGRETIGDIKVVKVRKDKKQSPPLSYRCQLSAYAKMLGQNQYQKYRRISLYLTSPYGDITEPKLLVFDYKNDYYPDFEACMRLWSSQYNDIEEPDESTEELLKITPELFIPKNFRKKNS